MLGIELPRRAAEEPDEGGALRTSRGTHDRVIVLRATCHVPCAACPRADVPRATCNDVPRRTWHLARPHVAPWHSARVHVCTWHRGTPHVARDCASSARSVADAC